MKTLLLTSVKLTVLASLVFLGGFSVYTAHFALADDVTDAGAEDDVTAAGAIPSVQLINPLKNINSIGDLLEAILHIIMILMIPIIVFYIIYSGFKYVTALGNASQVEEASQSLLYAVIGGVLILGSLAIVEIIKNVVAQF